MHEVPSKYTASLLSICVSTAHAGKGIGKTLLLRLEKELIAQNLSGYFLTTDAENNRATNYFYLNNGFKSCDIYNQGKRKMILYVKDLK
jgi:ribosomal protein S18 acetylase RimI-like enzyme